MVNSIILSGMAWASSLKDAIVNHHRDEGGQDMMEYAVIVGAIALTVAGVISFGGASFFVDAINNFRDQVAGCLYFDGDACGIG